MRRYYRRMTTLLCASVMDRNLPCYRSKCSIEYEPTVTRINYNNIHPPPLCYPNVDYRNQFLENVPNTQYKVSFYITYFLFVLRFLQNQTNYSMENVMITSYHFENCKKKSVRGTLSPPHDPIISEF